MASPHAPRPQQVTPTQLLDIREREWGPLLAAVSLVSEADIPQQRLEQAATALGALFTSALDRRRNPLLTRWPTCTAAATVGVATARYSGGTFWPALWEVAGVPPGRQNADTWGKSFLRSLELLGKDAFPGHHLPYVTPILIHSGIPTYCLTDVFVLLLERTAVSPGLDAPAFHQWAASGRNRLNGLDVPAQRFIAGGGDYSLEVIERCMSLLDRLRDAPETDCQEVGLPPRFLEPAQTALEQASARGTLPARRTGHGGHHRPARPRLRLDPYVYGVHLELPVIGDTDDDIVQWRITTDGATHLVRGQGRWMGGTGMVEPVRFPISMPTRTVRAGPRGTDAEERLSLIDPNDPVLVFTDDGELVDRRLSLPPGLAWLLHPADHELRTSEDTTALDHAEAPYGWEGWTLLRVRLERGGWIALADGARHSVHGRARPHLEQDAAVPGVTTPQGSPVHADLPEVVLPEPEGAPARWRIEVLSTADSRPLLALDASSGERISALAELPRPVVGRFVINVRGPLGRGMRRHVTVAEGLEARYTPESRTLTPGGLDPGEARIAGPTGLAARPARLGFTPEQTSHTADLRADATTLTVAVTPPHFALLTTGDTGAQWRPNALKIDTESVADAGDLLVRLPAGRPDAAAELTPLSVLADDEVVQQVQPSARPGDPVVRYPLGQIGDTAAAHPRLRMVVGHADRVMPVAVISPRRLAESAHREDGALVLDGFCGIKGVNAALYAHHAPWRGPEVLAIPPSGRVPLPEELGACGPLRVLLAVDDPWSLTEWPRWPHPHAPNLLACPAAGRLEGDDPQESLLSHALAGGGDLAELHPTKENAVRLWRVVGLSTELRKLGVSDAGIERCTEALGRFPVTALLAHGEAGLSPDESTRTLILSGLVGAPQHDWVTAEEAAELWQRLPAAAALATSDLLPRIPFDPDRQTPEHHAVLEEVEQQCGANGLHLLDGEADPAATVGRFDDTTEQLARMPDEQVDAVWRAARVVPRALLDSDSRTSAALGLFTHRRGPELVRARHGAARITGCALAMGERLPEMYREAARALIAARQAPRSDGWRNLPAVSVALAVAARLAARGVPSFQTLERSWRPMWAELASAAPGIAVLDIVLAELTLAGIERTSLFAKEQQ